MEDDRKLFLRDVPLLDVRTTLQFADGSFPMRNDRYRTGRLGCTPDQVLRSMARRAPPHFVTLFLPQPIRRRRSPLPNILGRVM